MNATPEWAYQPPYTPPDYPRQHYYRGSEKNHAAIARDFDAPLSPYVVLYRGAGNTTADLSVSIGHVAQIDATLTAPQLLALRNALSDALHDIEACEVERERRESFDRIRDELRDAEMDGCEGRTGVWYAHPDIHYVPAGQVKAKVRELKANGCPRFVVLSEDFEFLSTETQPIKLDPLDRRFLVSSEKLPDAPADQGEASRLEQQPAGMVDPRMTGDLKTRPHLGLQRVVDPLPETEQKASDRHQQNGLVGDLQGHGQRQNRQPDAHDREQLVPVVDRHVLDRVDHVGPPVVVDRIDDPTLPEKLAAAMSGSGPSVALVGMKVVRQP
jgi:hypothetical protein